LKREIKCTEFHNGKLTDGLWKAEKVGRGKRKSWVSKREITIEYDDESEYIVTERVWVFPAGFKQLTLPWKPDEYLSIDPLDQTVKKVIYPDSDYGFEMTPDITEYRDYPGVVKETGESKIIHCYVTYSSYDMFGGGEKQPDGSYMCKKPEKKIKSPVYYHNDDYGICETHSNPKITKLVLEE